jgi:hypothetical protein
MDLLAAIGLAGIIVQFVDSERKIIVEEKELYKHSSLVRPLNLEFPSDRQDTVSSRQLLTPRGSVDQYTSRIGTIDLLDFSTKLQRPSYMQGLNSMADRERSGDDGVKPNASSFHSLPLVTYYSAFPFLATDKSQPCPAKGSCKGRARRLVSLDDCIMRKI